MPSYEPPLVISLTFMALLVYINIGISLKAVDSMSEMVTSFQVEPSFMCSNILIKQESEQPRWPCEHRISQVLHSAHCYSVLLPSPFSVYYSSWSYYQNDVAVFAPTVFPTASQHVSELIGDWGTLYALGNYDLVDKINGAPYN